MSDPFSHQLRLAIRSSGRSVYSLSCETQIDKSTLSRFMASKGGLSLSAVDSLVFVLGLKLVPETRRNKKTGGGTASDSPAPFDPTLL
jgi:hypothetical protein